MDFILKEYFDLCRNEGKLPAELEGKIEQGYRLFSDDALLKVWRSNRKGLRWTDPDGNTLIGAIDNVLEKDGKLIVLDYKTRGFPLKHDTAEHYQDQLNIYNLLFRKNGYETEDFSYLLFYYPELVRSDGKFLFHNQLVKMNTSALDGEGFFIDAVKIISGRIPESSDNCEYCKWTKNTAKLEEK